MDSSLCKKCGAELCQDDKALHRKLVNRGTTEFMCKNCLSEYLKIPTEKLDELIAYYREQGCTLFN